MKSVLDRLGRVCGEQPLADCEESLDALQVLSLGLIIEDVSDLAREDPGTTTSLMDPHHGHSHWPGSIANSQLKVLVMGSDVLLHQAVLHDQVEPIQDLPTQIVFLQKLQQRLHIPEALSVHSYFYLSIGCSEERLIFCKDLFFPGIEHFLAPKIY